MTCAEIQDRLWDDPTDPHVRQCKACTCALEEIRAIRASLREGTALDRLAGGVIARLSRPRPLWPHAFRYCAGLLIGLIGALALRSDPPAPAPQIRIVRKEPVYPGFDRLLKQLGSDRPSERAMIAVLNEALRQSGLRVAQGPSANLEVNQ